MAHSAHSSHSPQYPLYIDNRVGSKDLEEYISDLGLPYELTHLDSGDFQIIGNYDPPDTLTPGTGVIPIGIERKRVDDLISSIDKGRVQDSQLVSMSEQYAVSYLLVEGMFRLGPGGCVEKVPENSNRWVPIVNQNFTYRRLIGMLIRIQQTGVKLLYTNTAYETAIALQSIHSWWSKPWADHEYQNVYTPHNVDGVARTTQGPLRYRTLPDHQKYLWRAAQDLDGVMNKAAEFVVQFKTVQNMVNSNLPDFEKIVGKGLRARKIMELIRGRSV